MAVRHLAGWHERRTRGTPLDSWMAYWRTGALSLDNADGVITVFPQLAVTTAINRSIKRCQNKPIVAWCFNLGQLGGAVKRLAARKALAGVERFVVHSSGEVQLISDYLDVPIERVLFVPLQRAPIDLVVSEDCKTPFAVAMGSANRDYATLFEAARYTRIPIVVVASARAVDGMDVPENVQVRSALSVDECHSLAQRARFSIVPLADSNTASGQVTVVEAQCMRRPVIATRSIGTVDYIADGKTGLLVTGGDSRQLAGAMAALWEDATYRGQLAAGAAEFANEKLSDEAAGRVLAEILDDVSVKR